MSIIAYRAGGRRAQTPQDPPIATWHEDSAGIPSGYVLSLDIGQARDWSAVVLNQRVECERIEFRRYTPFESVIKPYDRKTLIRHELVRLHRYPLGTSYPDVCRSIRSVVQQLPAMRDAPELIVDGTGVGRPVVEAMRELGLVVKSVTITGGTGTSQKGMDYRIAKSALASQLDVVLSEGRLRLASSDPWLSSYSPSSRPSPFASHPRATRPTRRFAKRTTTTLCWQPPSLFGSPSVGRSQRPGRT